jgi:cytochrome c553
MIAGRPMYRVIALALSTALAAMAGGASASAGDVDRGKAKAVLCVACHGATGIGAHPDIPNLAGQQEPYLVAQIKAFRRAELGQAKPGEPAARYDAVMGHQAAGMTDADAEDLAAYYSSRPCAPEKIAKGEPAVTMANQCAGCHGAFGRSTNLLVPRLAGQHETYLENQLKAFRGVGRGKPAGVVHRLRVHPVMGPRGIMLNDQDITELAGYFAGLSCR